MEDIRKKQASLLELLREFDCFARKNGITYFVAYGTCLGAVREKGFIPWDGDIDILMRMPDYIKAEKLLRGNPMIKWVSYRTNSAAPNLMGRVYSCDVKMDRFEDYPYIDMFALAGMPNDSKLQKRIMSESLRNYRIYWIKKRHFSCSLYRRKSRIGLLLQFLLFLYPARVCRKVFEREMAQYPYETSEYVAPISGLYGLKDVLPQKWFERAPVYLPFCDMKVPVIAEFNEYLRHMYGDDYMTPHQFSRYK